jgi:hypothetical protein
MGLFKSEPQEAIDPELIACLIPQKNWAVKKLATIQPTLQKHLVPGERVSCIALERFGNGPAVVTDARVLVLYTAKSDQIAHSLDPNGLKAEILIQKATNNFKITLSHPAIFDDTARLMGAAGAEASMSWNIDDYEEAIRFGRTVNELAALTE